MPADSMHETPQLHRRAAPSATGTDAFSSRCPDDYLDDTLKAGPLKEVEEVCAWPNPATKARRLTELAKSQDLPAEARAYAVEGLRALPGQDDLVIPALLWVWQFDPDEQVRLAAVRSIAVLPEVTPSAAVGLLAASCIDPSAEVRKTARGLQLSLAEEDRAASETVQGVLSTLCEPGQARQRGFRFGNLSIPVILNPVTNESDTHTREQRIEAAVERISDAVAELPQDEQGEAEVKALVTNVPATASYPEQLRAFTGITHVMRVMMARQLEQPFREYLRDDSPRLDPALGDDRKRQSQDLASRKAMFAEQVTDGLFRLGLSVFWDGEGPCYFGTNTSPQNARGRYSIHKCGESGHLDYVTDWHKGRNVQTEEISRRLERASLFDAAAPGKPNRLKPARIR
jgi:hypothetical protein